MLRLLFLFFFINISLFANEFETAFQATVQAEPSMTIEGVNLMTGQLYLNQADIKAEGKEPLYYMKTYTSLFSGYSLDDLFNRWAEIEDARHVGWGSDKHMMAYIANDTDRIKDDIKRVNRRIDVYEPNGVMLTFEFPQIESPKYKFWEMPGTKKDKKENFEMEKAAVRKLKLIETQNFYQGGITNARDNYKNTTATADGEHFLKIKSADGTIRQSVRRADPSRRA